MSPGQYQVVGGIVSPVSDCYGKQGLILAKHRIAMARLALQSSNWVTVDEWESQQPDWTETVVTMRYRTNLLPPQSWNVFTYQGKGWATCRMLREIPVFKHLMHMEFPVLYSFRLINYFTKRSFTLGEQTLWNYILGLAGNYSSMLYFLWPSNNLIYMKISYQI